MANNDQNRVWNPWTLTSKLAIFIYECLPQGSLFFLLEFASYTTITTWSRISLILLLHQFLIFQSLIITFTPNANQCFVLFCFVFTLQYCIGFAIYLHPTTGHTHQGNQNWKRHLYPNVHCSTVYNSQDMEAISVSYKKTHMFSTQRTTWLSMLFFCFIHSKWE